MKTTQSTRLLAHLQTGRKVNRMIALNELGILELSARLCELKTVGHVISKERMRSTNRFGEDFGYIDYRLVVVPEFELT